MIHKAVLVGILSAFVYYLHFHLYAILGYLLMFNANRDLNLEIWRKNIERKLDRRIILGPTPVPVIMAEKYNIDAVKIATNNYRRPAVIRGLLANTTGTRRWHEKDYLNNIIGDFLIPLVLNARIGSLQNERNVTYFKDAFSKIYSSEYTTDYIFFPVKSRFQFPGWEDVKNQEMALDAALEKLIAKDLDLDRIWPGFGRKETHSIYTFGQLVIGKSAPVMDSKDSTGSDFHCAMGNNWFVQVKGRKKWQFVEPKYSAFMSPLKGGRFNMWNGNKDMKELLHHIPHYEITLEEGDVLYNPAWMWHKVSNYGGFSIGVPMRESKGFETIRNNMYFTTVAFTNIILENLGLGGLGGYAPSGNADEAN